MSSKAGGFSGSGFTIIEDQEDEVALDAILAGDKRAKGAVVHPFEIYQAPTQDTEGLIGEIPSSSEEDDKTEKASSSSALTNMWTMANIGVGMSYFCVGCCSALPITPVSYYMVHELDAPAAAQQVVFTLGMLPWSLKLMPAFLSDNFPIWGQRRKPYFIAGWAVFSVCLLHLANMGRPEVFDLALWGFVASMGFILSDVTTDAIVVERSRNESVENKGGMQATGYALRFVGRLLGSILGSVLHNKDSWGWGMSISQIYLLTALIPPAILGPTLYHLEDHRVSFLGGCVAVQSSLVSIFGALSKQAVYIPMSFVFIYNTMQVSNVAWRSFLVDGLEFKAWTLGLLSICGALFSSIGIVSYKHFFFQTSWRKIYVNCTLLGVLFSILQLLLIYRVNIAVGIPDLAFALGDDAFAEFVRAIQFLPLVQMYLAMCPEGAEGSTYAIITTLGNLAGAVSLTISTSLADIWDVSNRAIEAGEYSGMAKLTILTSLLQPIPLLLIGLIPANKTVQRKMQEDETSSRLGGWVFVSVILISLAWTIGLAAKVVYQSS